MLYHSMSMERALLAPPMAINLLQISENLSLCDFPRSGTALWRGRKAPAGPGTGGAQGARILRGAAPEAGTPHRGPSSRHPPAVWRRARRGLRLLGTRHVPVSQHASARGTARVPGARRGALAAPLLRQTRGGWSSWGFGGLVVCAVHGSCAQARLHGT